MQWTDKAIVINIKKHGENSSIVTLLTEHHGLYSGMVKSITSSKARSIYQIGNIIEVTWKARISEHLGMFSAEILNSIVPIIMLDYMKLLTLKSICALINICLGERISENRIFLMIEELLLYLKNQDHDWLEKYALFELNLLSELGFGLDLDECVVTNVKNNLKYISPKSGKAVSEAAAIPYIDKLFKLPEFLIDHNIIPDIEAIKDSLYVTGYFLNKFLLSIDKKELPADRTILLNKILKKNLI